MRKELLAQKVTRNACEVHKQPLLLFCDERECQEQLCAQCSVHRHAGHRIVNIEEKAAGIKHMLAIKVIRLLPHVNFRKLINFSI